MPEDSSFSRMRRKPTQARSHERVERILEAAEKLFIEKGYGATTTNAIATQADVSIGSLYQFFPDKSAILLALAVRYGDLLQQEFVSISVDETLQCSLAAYADRLVDTTIQFFEDYPGYYAIFFEAQSIEPDVGAIEDACDAQVVSGLAVVLAHRDSRLKQADCDAISFVLVKAVGTLLWLSLREKPPFQHRLIAEAKRLASAYLNQHIGSLNL